MTETNNEFHKFSQFSKVEEDSHGGALVWGVATREMADLDNEICDYQAAKAVYSGWNADAIKRTSSAGQEVSLGPIRLQHGTEIGGKAVKVEYDDASRQIWLGSKPINDDVLSKLRQGFFTGYSQGGTYAWRKCATCDHTLPTKQAANFCVSCGKNVQVRYGLKSLSEVSYVDAPCSGAGFAYVKSDGSAEVIKFARKPDFQFAEVPRGDFGGLDFPPDATAKSVAEFDFYDAPAVKTSIVKPPVADFKFAALRGDFGGL